MRSTKQLAIAVFTLLFGLSASAQEKSVTGTVVSDDDNTPLFGVSVKIKGSGKGVQTNAAGYYSIQAKKGDVLTYSYVGYVRQEMTVGDGNMISIKLVQSDKQIGEVVVTAYGTKKNKRELSYLAQEVKGEEIAQTQRDNFLNALAGRVAGANITPTSGAPGASTSIVLRGAVSIGGNNQPLIVVDGIPYDNQTMNQENLAQGNSVSLGNRSSDYGNRAMDLNSEDIESVTILKGPEATALYGSDGSSGAIVIVTKKGKSGRGNVTYDNSFRWEKVYRFPEQQKVYGRGLNGVADPNATVSLFGVNNTAFFGPKYTPNTQLYDNFKNFFGVGFTQRHNLNVEGGNDGVTYRLSTQYMNQDGMVPNTAFERLSVRFSGGAKISKKVNITSSFNYVASVTDKASRGVGGYFLSLLNFPADVDVRDYQTPNGNRKLVRGTSALTSEYDNPYWDVNKNTAQDKTDRFTTNLTVNYDPFKWLNLNGVVGIDTYTQTGDFLVHPYSRFGVSTNGFYSIYEQITKNLSTVLKGTLKRKFGQFQNNLTVGFTADDNKTRIEGQRGEQFFEINYKSINNTTPLSRNAVTNIFNTRKVRFFGNYTIGYKNMLFASFAGSREGSSTLLSTVVDKNPYFNYGSASLSFVFSDLNIFEKQHVLSYGKARISYGTTGKAPLIPYVIDPLFQSQITTGGGYAYGFFGNNQGLQPEFTKNFEVGGELKFFKNRLSLDVTHYELRSSKQILSARSSYGTGYVIKYFNGGEVENKGWEAVINYNVIKKKKFNWDVTVNFDRNRGRIVSMPADLPTYYDSDTWVFGNLRSQVFAGAANGNLAGYTSARNNAGQILISPTSSLPSSNGDFVTVGNRQPDFKVGLINKFDYKDFSLSFNLDFRKGGDVFNGNEYYLFLTGGSTRTLDRERLINITGVLNDGLQNTATPTPSTITVNPYFRSDYFGSGVATEADFIESVNWMRLRDVTFTYRLAQSVVKKQKVFRSAQVFVTGTDLFIVTNYTGADPSVNTNTAFSRGFGGAGIDYGSLATPRGIIVGCKFQF